VPKAVRKRFDSWILLCYWMISKERNNRVFNNAMKQAAELASWIKEESLLWPVGGGRFRCSVLYPFFFSEKKIRKNLGAYGT
jgi:hypothetical protein